MGSDYVVDAARPNCCSSEEEEAFREDLEGRLVELGSSSRAAIFLLQPIKTMLFHFACDRVVLRLKRAWLISKTKLRRLKEEETLSDVTRHVVCA